MTLMPEFRRQLLEAAADRPSRTVRRHGQLRVWRLAPARRPRGAAVAAPVAVAGSILVVIAVAAFAFTLGSARRGHRLPHGPEAGTVPGVAAARRQLIDELGALRRGIPATVGAHLPLPSTGTATRIDRVLVRTVRTEGYTVTLIPVSQAVGRAPGGRTTNLVVEVQGPRVPSGFPAIAKGSLTIANAVTPAAIARQGETIVMYVSGALNRAVVLVPDGVSRVQLSGFRPDRSSFAGPASIRAASAAVHDNVAVIPLPGVTTTSLNQTRNTVHDHGGLFSLHHCHVNAALYFVPVTVRMSWLRLSGRGGSWRTVANIPTSLDAYSKTLLPAAPATCHHG